jgi:hypothetical protein
MLKRTVLLISAAFAVLAIHSCSLPTIPKKVRITGNPRFELPVITGSIDLNKIIDENLKKDLPEGIDLYDADYTYQNEQIQAFLVRYEMVKRALNPGDYLNDYDDAMGNFSNLNIEIDPINESFLVPDFTPGSGGGGTPINIPLTELFDRAKDAATFGAQVGPLQMTTIGSCQTLTPPGFSPDIPLSGFDTLTFSYTKLVMTVRISAQGSSLPPPTGVDIAINGATLTGFSPSSPITGNSISLDNNAPSNKIYFDLDGQTISSSASLQFSLGTITDDSSSYGLSFDMHISIGWEASPEIRAATGLKINEVATDLPSNSPITVDLGNMPQEFLHAEIGVGKMTIGLPDMPYKNVVTDIANETWFDHISLKYDITLEQEDYEFDNEINGSTVTEQYPGLNARIQINEGDDYPLNGKDLNQNDIEVLTNGVSKIIIVPGLNGIDFHLSDADMVTRSFSVTLEQSVDIDSIAAVHYDIGNTISIPGINDPPNLKDAGDYVRWIEFEGVTPESYDDGIGINFKFEEVLPGIEVSLRCDDFDPPLNVTKELVAGDNVFKNSQPTKLNINPDANGDVLLDFKISLQGKKDPAEPYGGGKVIKLTNINLGDELKIRTPTERDKIIMPFFVWTKALVSLGDQGSFDDRYPLPTDNPPVLDLNDMLGKYMKGFGLEGAQAALYISGPDIVNKIDAQLSFAANYNLAGAEYQTQLPLVPADFKLTASPGKVSVPLVDGRYTSSTLPAGGIEMEMAKINQIMNDLPADMIFRYKMAMNELEVTPDLFDGVDRDASDLVVELMMLMPMRLKAGDQGGTISLTEVFKEEDGEEKDLLGRKKPEDIADYLAAGGIYIDVQFNSGFFSDMLLKIDKNNRVFPNGIHLGGRSLRINIGGQDLTALKNDLLIPDIRMELPPGASLKIPKDLGVTKIGFGASDLGIELDMP